MQNVGQSENRNIDKVNVQLDVVKSSTPQSSASSPAKSETETYSGAPAKFMTDSSESEDDSVSEAEMGEEGGAESSKFLLSNDDPERGVDPEMQARLEALLEAAGIGKLSGEGKHLADPEVLRRLTSSVSCALDEAAAALTRMRSDQPPAPHHHRHHHQDKPTQCGSTASGTTPTVAASVGADGAPSLAEACSDGDVGTVRKLLTEGRSVHETTEEGESLLSLACSAGYYELAQVLLAMHASVEDRGIKGDCTPLMEAASAGHVDIVRLLVAHGADVNAVSGSGNTPLMYACAGGHEDCVRALLENGANVEEHNENGHTPLMEAASAGHVGVAKILLEHGAGINTHSNEFKESALTLACYKGHLDMVRFLLAAGADREHKTDEMHTALMEASMDGHVEVARLLLDSGAQVSNVNMPTDSFESPLTLAACGGHVELAMLLLERGANIEEVNDEGYTPLMEAAREGHEEMVALLLGQGASINAQTDETQETALTLACCGGFLEVVDFLIKAGADVELGASTPLMEASQEGHLELVRYLLNAGADVHARTQTGDTALTYACENGHTSVAELLLRAGAELEHESEGGRTPLMKACRAGHLCTVHLLIGKGADVNRMTASGDHTALSLACAGGHVDVVKFLLACDADPFRKLKDNSTTLIEAAKGGHTAVVRLLLDYPRSVMLPRDEPCPEDTGGGPPQPAGAAGVAAAAEAESPGLSAAQAAALGLAHAPAPGAPTRALLPAQPPHHHNAYVDGRKKPPPGAPPPAAGPAGPAAPPGTAGAAAPPGTKHKCPRKQRPAPHHDHHLPPPPDILDEQRSEQERNVIMMTPETLEETERTLQLMADNNSVPPTLATSALHALDVQFCAQGVTTSVHPPTTPPYPPPQGMFPSTRSLTSDFQLQVPQPPPAQPQLALEPRASLKQQSAQQLAQKQLLQHQLTQQHQQFVQEGERPEGYAQPSGEEGAGYSEARELCAVLAYLQREVPSLVALPPNELRELVLQVMQQKSADILSGKCDADGADLSRARNVLTAEQPQDDLPNRPVAGGCEQDYYQLVPPAASPQPAPAPLAPLTAHPAHPTHPSHPAHPAPPAASQPTDCRSGTFAPPAPAPAPPQPPQHTKRDHTNAPKKKIRYNRLGPGVEPPAAPACPRIDVDGETESNHDTALTLACAGGHDDLVELLLARGADHEHRDKKGFTPLILAATAGHEKIVEILLNHGADMEAQSERTKDTPLSLACSGGRYEVVELILSRGANKEHRNVSDYTPLSLAASGGYVNIIRLLLHHQAEINSRTGSKLGISPLMLAAMNGHTAAVKLLLDCGSDINAQIETNRNTALTLACFQGRHEVVSLLLDRKANVEHRAKTGLTPLMEAASGGYVEVGRVLLDKGADVNAPPVPSSRDTALTIAADKGHTKFVELLLQRRAAVEVKNKKGNSPLWLAANGGHLAVVEMLYACGADIDSQDNRKVSCLMAAFRKGHTKVVKWMVGVVTQFPSDQEMTRYICTISDKELLEKCQECVRVIRAAKETQAARANQNATILLEELDAERCREENRRQAAARRRERKKKKKMEKKEQATQEEERRKQEGDASSEFPADVAPLEHKKCPELEPPLLADRDDRDSGIDANSQGSCSSSDVKAPPAPTAKSKKKKKEDKPAPTPAKKQPEKTKIETKPEKEVSPPKTDKKEKENVAPPSPPATPAKPAPAQRTEKREKKPDEDSPKSITVQNVTKYGNNSRKSQVFESSRLNLDNTDVDTFDKNKKNSATYTWEAEGKNTSPKGANANRREEGWKEVVRKSSVQTLSTVEPGCKKVSVASHAISRVIGRAGSNINAIRAATGAHIEVDKQNKGQGERIITIKGSAEASKQAAALIGAMIRDPDADITALLPRRAAAAVQPPAQAKPAKQAQPAKASTATTAAPPRGTPRSSKHAPAPRLQPATAASTAATAASAASAARHHAHAVTPEKRVSATSVTSPTSCSGTALSYSLSRSHTFAAKLTAHRAHAASQGAGAPPTPPGSAPPAAPAPAAAPRARLAAKPDPPRALPQLSPDTSGSSWTASEESSAPGTSTASALHINTTTQTSSVASSVPGLAEAGTQHYSLFKEPPPPPALWPDHADHAPPQVDANKAPGYRGGGCSPSSRASSHGSTPPPPPPPPIAPIAPPMQNMPLGNVGNTTVSGMDMSGLSRNGPMYQDNSRNGHNMMVGVGSVGLGGVGLGYVGVGRMPDTRPPMHKHPQQQLFGSAASSTNISALLMSYQQQQQQQQQQQHKPMPPMAYQSLLERGAGCTTGAAPGAPGGPAWADEERNKPRPIGTERAWKLSANDDWHHLHLPNDRYQPASSGVAGAAGVAGGAGAESFLPLLYLPPAAEPRHWDHPHQHKQAWSKWTQ